MAKEPASAKPAKAPRPLDPDDHVRIIRGLVRDFRKNPPPGAEGGLYGAAAHDRWAKRHYRVPDGTYTVGDWTVTFAGERFTGAVHGSRKGFRAKHAVDIGEKD